MIALIGFDAASDIGLMIQKNSIYYWLLFGTADISIFSVLYITDHDKSVLKRYNLYEYKRVTDHISFPHVNQ